MDLDRIDRRLVQLPRSGVTAGGDFVIQAFVYSMGFWSKNKPDMVEIGPSFEVDSYPLRRYLGSVRGTSVSIFADGKFDETSANEVNRLISDAGLRPGLFLVTGTSSNINFLCQLATIVREHKALVVLRIALGELAEADRVRTYDAFTNAGYVFIDHQGRSLSASTWLRPGGLSWPYHCGIPLGTEFARINVFRSLAQLFWASQADLPIVGLNMISGHAIKKRLTVIVDDEPSLVLKEGKSPIFRLSHNRTLLRIGQKALDAGWEVQVSVEGRNTARVKSLLPFTQFGSAIEGPAEGPFDTDVYVTSKPILLSRIQNRAHSSIGIWVASAIHWVEKPMGLAVDFVNDLREALIYDIDFLVTQNDEMREHMLSMATLVSNWDFEDRALVVPNALSEHDRLLERRLTKNLRDQVRNDFGYSQEDLVILNSGGVWSWTDVDVFLTALVSHFRKFPESRLRFVQAGLRQAFIKDHDDIIARVNLLAGENPDLFESGRIRLISDWDAATGKLADLLLIADIGLNVSKPSIESAQSMRQRFIDYVDVGIPVIQSKDTGIMRSPWRHSCVFVEASSVSSYENLLSRLSRDPSSVLPDPDTLLKLRKDYSAASDPIAMLNLVESIGPLKRSERMTMLARYRDLPSFRHIYHARLGNTSSELQIDEKVITLRDVEQSGRIQLALLKRTIQKRLYFKMTRLKRMLARLKVR